MFDSKKSAIRTSAVIIVITLAAKVLGLLRESMLAAYYGAGMMANAFLTASLIPATFYDVAFESLISICFIPAFNTVFVKEGKEASFTFANRFLTMVVLCTLVLALAGCLLPLPLVRLFAPGFDARTTALASGLLRVMMPMAVFSGITFTLAGILQSFHRFRLPAALSLFHNLVIILYFLLLNRRFGIYGLAAAFMAGWVMQIIVQLPAAGKTGYRFRPDPRFWQDRTLRATLMLVPSAMTGTWVQPINIMVATRFASALVQGTGSSYAGYANVLYRAICGVLILSVTNLIFPALSRMAAREDKASGFDTVMATLRGCLFLIIPLSAGVAIFSHPLVRLIYQRGDFTAADTRLTGIALGCLALGMAGYALSSVLLRAFFSMGDGTAPLVCGGVSIAANMVLCRLLSGAMGLAGLMLACSLAVTVYAVLLYLCYLSKHRDIPHRGLGRFPYAVLAGTGVMCCCILPMGQLLQKFSGPAMILLLLLGLCALIGLCVYFAVCLLLKIPEARLVFNFVKGKL